MEQNFTNTNAWYEKTWLVILLCVVFFPVGIYALWKNATINKGVKIIITVVIGIILMTSLRDEKKDADSKEVKKVEDVLSDKKEQFVADIPEKELIKWNFSESIDKMTSNKIKFASVEATEELEFKFPYDGGSIATLTIRNKDNNNDIYLHVSKGQFNRGYDGGDLRIKFDDNPPHNYSFSSASDGSSDLIFINATKGIISKLKVSKKVIIEVEFFNEGIRQIEFDVQGFKW